MNEAMRSAPKFQYALDVVRLAATALAVTGIAVGIYASSASVGNAQETTCVADESKQQALSDAAQGELAAFSTKYPSQDLSGLSFNDKDGKPVTLADWKGKTVLFNLWATWCAPCRYEMPALQQLNTDLEGGDFEVVAVSIDLNDPAKPKEFYEETKLDKLGFFHDGTMGVFNELKKAGLALGMPTTILIGKDGCSIGVLSGPAEWASDDAKTLINAAM